MLEYWKKNILSCWPIFARNYQFLITAQILLFLVYLYPSIELRMIQENFINYNIPLSKIILIMALSLMYIGIDLGSVSITYNSIMNKKIEFRDIFQQFHKIHLILIPYIGLSIIFIILISIVGPSLVSLICFISLYLLFLFFYNYLIIIEQLSIKEALTKGYYLFMGNVGLILQYCLIAFLIYFICFLILQQIGLIFAMCFSRIMGINLFLVLSRSIKIN